VKLLIRGTKERANFWQ